MKKINKLMYLFSVISLFLLSSCLRDDSVEDMEYGILAEQLETNKILEFPVISHVKSLPVLIEGEEATVIVGEVHLAAKKVAQEDITVNLNVISDRAQVLEQVRYLLPNRFPKDGKHPVSDEDILSFPGTGIMVPASVTIPKGKSSANVEVKLKTKDIQAASSFVVLNIVSAAQEGYLVSGNFGKLLLDIKVKSAYEGSYNYELESLGPWSQYYKYVEQGEVYLNTVSPNKVQIAVFNGLFGVGDIVVYEFDSATNKIVSMSWPTYPKANPIKIIESTYDESTKTATVKWEIAPAPGKVIVERFTRLD